jgi:hypothetical protein
VEQGWNSSLFCESLKVIFLNTLPADRILKSIALACACLHSAALLNRHEFEKICSDNAELSFEIMKAVVTDRETRRKIASPGMRVACPRSSGHEDFIVRSLFGGHRCTQCNVTF